MARVLTVLACLLASCTSSLATPAMPTVTEGAPEGTRKSQFKPGELSAQAAEQQILVRRCMRLREAMDARSSEGGSGDVLTQPGATELSALCAKLGDVSAP
eukprot:TRINITY_DN60677_c0_g1_i1.p3 TRINITY_DN60677_c0_g1~~TRINITY_DN60677_c0_g1_i1.p3  ORF type:complete len:101 (+),score=15.20 TRINITY_DN60677_c0_g1_i1:78-380(+)